MGTFVSILILNEQIYSEPEKFIDFQTISIGTIGSDPNKLINRFQPTIDYIAKNLETADVKFQGQVKITKTPDDMANLLKTQELDIYMDSPIILMLVSEQSEAEPILIRWKEGSEFYHSVFFVRSDSKIFSIGDLQGKKIIFEDPESTSGYLLPKAHLISNGYAVDTDVADIIYEFSGDDENTPVWIIEGRGDVGVVSNQDFDEFLTPIKLQLRIIETTIELPRQVVALRSDLDSNLTSKIKEILINMDKDT
jgi:phosphonate transport system substrate-binding protein